MGNFSKITSFFLALTVVFSTCGQIQNSFRAQESFSHSEGNNAPAFANISSQIFWGVINLDRSGSSLLNIYPFPDSEEDQKNSSKTELARESALERFSSFYLLLSRDIEGSPTVRELLYPFHFYF